MDRLARVLSWPVRAGHQVAAGVTYARVTMGKPARTEVAADAIGARLASRAGSFLDTVERAIVGYRDSPYRALLDAAGIEMPRLRVLVATEGVEGALRQLCKSGVYVSIEEFKGVREARRGAHTFRFNEKDFNNPLVRSGLQASSGGTRSRGIITTISPSNQRMGAEHLAVALAAYGLERLPVAVWLPRRHGASVWAVLALAATGNSAPYWFNQFPSRLRHVVQTAPHQLAIRAWCSLHAIRLPRPVHVPYGEEARVLPWITDRRAAPGWGIFTTPSTALRVALTAKRAGTSLSGVTFITIGEPLTPAKLEGIRDAGAQAFSSLGFTEFGRATYGCAAPASADDTHICRDAVAVIQRRRPVDRMGSEIDALLFTSLLPDARRILLNMETGDYATMTARRCGCGLERMGWTDHLEGIRSFEKFNAEGRLFFGSQLIALIEDVLPTRFGGDPTDYQLVEHEDHEGLTRMDLLVHPRLGAIDEAGVRQCITEALVESHGRRVARPHGWWDETGTVRVRRAVPILTKAGKLMPLHQLGLQPPVDGELPAE